MCSSILGEMAQCSSFSTLSANGNCVICGFIPLWRSHDRLVRKANVASGTDKLHKQCHLHQSVQSLHIMGRRSLRVEAGWLFNKGGDQELDASCERSESANEDILIFFFQLDLATRVQYALNVEQYDIAQELRNKLTEVEAEVIRQNEAKRGSSSQSEAQDKGLSILRLRADLQNAVANENYAMAAKLRDHISKLEAESLAASAKALVYENAQYTFRLGQKVRHKIFGYQAVVCGMDPVCCETTSWMETAGVEKLARGSNQPFYQVLVDVHAYPDLLVAYVPEENLVAFEKPDLGRFDHPYLSFLFYGADSAGDFISIKQLREKYKRPRYEVPSDPDESGEGAS